ncbi:hypothetical protein PT286_01085 [Neisseriaceae bacterium ESL0693]|nr:hypothetical protein [Neisseriaceae bacterium ESL0693]
MYRFFLDALAAIRLRFFNTAHYRYPLTVIMAILVTLSVLNTVAATPLLGTGTHVLFLWLIVTTLKWLLLSLVMRQFLSRPDKAQQNWSGYILMTEALMLPMILSFYWPQVFSVIGFFWQIWIWVVQFIGLKRISQVSGFKIAGAYLVYIVLALLCYMTVFVWFLQSGWLDMTIIQQNMEQLQNSINALPQ